MSLTSLASAPRLRSSITTVRIAFSIQTFPYLPIPDHRILVREAVRTTAYLLDASSEWLSPFIPVLKSVPPQMQFGLDSVIGAILPGVGDILGTFLGLYQVFLSMLFEIPLSVVGMMVRLLLALLYGAKSLMSELI